MRNAVELSRVYKKYRKNVKSLRNILGYLFNFDSADDFWALNDVSFALNRGDVLGIVGANGAGKSTILKILAKVTQPTQGKVRLKGKVGALIELGAGFHPELTGRENIFLYGSILGMKKKDIEKQYDSILNFSGLKDFIDTPVKFYSSGMFLRLGFSVTVHTDCDILLIDEVLAVGDEAFQKKCLEKISQLKSLGKTIIFVSHNLPLLINLCPKTIWLSQGKVKAYDHTEIIVKKYQKFIEKKKDGKIGTDNKQKKVEISSVKITDIRGKAKSVFSFGAPIKIQITYKNHNSINQAAFGIAVYNSYGIKIAGSSSKPIKLKNKFGKINVILKEAQNTDRILKFTFAISSPDHLIHYDWVDKKYTIRIGKERVKKSNENFTIVWK